MLSFVVNRMFCIKMVYKIQPNKFALCQGAVPNAIETEYIRFAITISVVPCNLLCSYYSNC